MLGSEEKVVEKIKRLLLASLSALLQR